MPDLPEPSDPLPPILIALKGVVWREDDERRWPQLFALQARVREHVDLLGLDLEVDEAEGYAFLRQRPPEEGVTELPRLIPRRPLSYPVSLLLVLLRKKLVEFDGSGGERRLILRRDDLVELLRSFLHETTNEAKLVDRIDAHVGKVVELGFLRPLKNRDGEYEVVRLLKAFVDAQWLQDFEARLAGYRAHAGSTEKDTAP
ncbi:MAG: DUF4194 domain-containing protein [Myxococcaceae bacterium]